MSKPIASLNLSHGYSVDKPVVLFTMIGGAGNQVTGSCTLISIIYKGKVTYGLIDCGIAQGSDEYRNALFPIIPKSLDFVIITHAHSDHSGALPLLRGYEGKVYATEGTFTAAKALLLDEANVNMRKAAAEYGMSDELYSEMLRKINGMKRHTLKKVSDMQPRIVHADLEELNSLSEELHSHSEELYSLMEEMEEIESMALFTKTDVEDISTKFHAVKPYQDIKIDDGIYFKLIPNPHINFATSVELYVGEYDSNSVNISFSGDIGPSESIFYKKKPYVPNAAIKYCFMESLHGLETPAQTEKQAYRELNKLRKACMKDDLLLMEYGFALDRDAKAVYAVNMLAEEQEIDFPIYFDSPLGIKELSVYADSYKSKDDCWFKDLGENPFSTEHIILAQKHQKRKESLESEDKKVVILAGAFGGGGRGIEYLKRYVQNARAVFVFLGWIDPECPTGKLLNAKQGDLVEIDGERYIKHCTTKQISGFSSHGYMPDFKEYLDGFPDIKGIILNHADRDVKTQLAEVLKEQYPVDFVCPEMFDEGEHCFYRLTGENISEISSFEAYEVLGSALEPVHISIAE